MNNNIYLIGEVGYEITLQSVIDKVKQSDQNKPLNIHIHSEGGYVYDGVAIYNYLKQLPQGVNTYAIGLVASSASIFFLAGKNRIAYPQNRVLIHLPMNGSIGNAEDLEKTAKDLREEEDKISDIYVAETNFTKEEALEQMREDKMFTTQQLIDKGFITELRELKAVAKLRHKSINKEEMNKEDYSKEDQGVIARFLKSVGLGGSDKKEPTNIIVKTADQEDLDFHEREEGEPVVGDKATLNGEAADGSIVMANGETFVFTDGTLDEIKEAEEEEEENLEAQLQALKDENERLKAEAINKVDKVEFEAKETELAKLQNTHSELINKLEGFTSTETIDTITKEPKKTVNKKETLTERLQRMSSTEN